MDRNGSRQCSGAQPESAVGPVAVNAYRTAFVFAGRNTETVIAGGYRHAELLNRAYREINIALGLQRCCKMNSAAARKGQGEHQTGYVLGTDIAGYGEETALQSAAESKGQSVPVEDHTVLFQLAEQRLQRTLGQSSSAGEDGAAAQSRRHGQQKAKGRAALSAVEHW